MLEMLFFLAVSWGAWIAVGFGKIDTGTASIITVLMLLWQMLCFIHKTLCEIKYK